MTLYPLMSTETADHLSLLTDILMELREIRREQHEMRSGAVSSVEVKDLASGKPQICIKRYTGSEPEVCETLADHALAHLEYDRLVMQGWQDTVENVAQERLNA